MQGNAAFNTNKTYKLGQEELRLQNYSQALDHFTVLLDEADYSDPHFDRYQSYTGLCQVLLGEKEGISLCRKSAATSTPKIENMCNLALAELQLNKRNNAIDAIQKGIKLDPKNNQLKKLKSRLDTRRKPFIPFISRDNFVNVMVGKITYRANRKAECTRIGKYSNSPMSFIV